MTASAPASDAMAPLGQPIEGVPCLGLALFSGVLSWVALGTVVAACLS